MRAERTYPGVLSRHPKTLLLLLSAALAALLFLTSLLSQERDIPDDLVDAVIFTIYLLLMLLVGTIALVIHALFDQGSVAIDKSPARETEAAPATKSLLKIEEESYVSGSGENNENARCSETLQRIRQQLQTATLEERQGFELLEASHAKPMAKYLMRQHPQVCAIVMIMIDAKKADAILEHFDASQREALLKRASESRPVSVSALSRLDLALYQELTPLRRDYARLKRLKDDEIRAILRQIDKRELMFALKGTTQELQERFFANMSSKASGEFLSKMASLPLPGTIKSQNAVKKLLLLAEQLRDDGRIQLTNKAY